MSLSPETAVRKGGCLCGDIRFEISADPLFGGFCQCRDCQRQTGTGHAGAMGFPQNAVMIAGTPTYYVSKAGSGATVSRGFCPRCGSRLVFTSSGLPGVVLVSPGIFDDPSTFKPEVVVFASRGQAWDHLDPALARFPEMPPPPPTQA
jgi:hypothetical protein